jgi:zinc protease
MIDTADERAMDRVAADAARAAGHAVKRTGFARYNAQLAAARFQLDNGLTIVLLADERAPVFAYQTWYRVGSKDESPERTGLAHLFEHLMFKGTTRHPVGELDRELESRGSQTNAATWADWTYYTCALAVMPGNLATVVDFESDRMRGLTLTQDVFASELDVVKNERRMTVDDSVMGRISETLFATSFTQHSYRWPTIGHLAHLETMQLEHARNFYDTYYAPNNATVVVVGALEPVEAITTIAKAYGPIPASKLPERRRGAEPLQTEAREARLKLPAVSAHVAIGYRAPGQNDPMHAALEIASEALLTGDNARLYKRLVTEEELATEVDGFLSPFAEPGIYEVLLTLRPGADAQKAIGIVQEELSRVAEGLTDSEWRKAQNGLTLSALDSLKDAEGLAEQLGHHETNSRAFEKTFEAVRRWEKVERAQVNEAAKTFFDPRRRTVVINQPEAT